MLEGVIADPAKAKAIDEYPEGAFNMYPLLVNTKNTLQRWDEGERHAICLARRHWPETREEGDLFEGLNGLEIILDACYDSPLVHLRSSRLTTAPSTTFRTPFAVRILSMLSRESLVPRSVRKEARVYTPTHIQWPSQRPWQSSYTSISSVPGRLILKTYP